MKEVGLVNFRVPSDVRQPAVRLEDRQPLRPAAHRRRHRPADRRRQAAARTRGGRRARSSTQATEGFDDVRRARRRRRPGTTIERGSGVERATIEQDRRPVRRGQERRLRLDDGHHAPRARRRERADDRQPGPAARHGRPAARGPAADPRPLATCRAWARSASRRSSSRQILDNLESLPRRQAAALAGPRHDGLHGGGRRGARCGRRSAWAATSTAATPTRRSPPRRSASSTWSRT